MKETFRVMNNVDSTAGVVTQSEKVDSNQLTELETNCVIQPSPLCLWLLISLATRIFGKKMVDETAAFWQSEGSIQSLRLLCCGCRM